jgi:hypothetical protein
MRGRLVVAVSCLFVAACSAGQEPPPCALTTGPLPGWARTGFSPPDQPVPYVPGAHGDILGVVFARPLQVPAAPGTNNKILWVSKEDSTGPLRIDARLAGSGLTATRELPDGPGPSTVDVPAPGCWSFELSWPGHHDRVSLAYQPG